MEKLIELHPEEVNQLVGTSTIVHWCAHMGRNKCMRALKAGGADFEQKDADGQVILLP